jgi:hypothetical protein
MASRSRIEGGEGVITVSSALTAALAHLQTQGAGHSITLPYSAFGNVSSIVNDGDGGPVSSFIAKWQKQHGLST